MNAKYLLTAGLLSYAIAAHAQLGVTSLPLSSVVTISNATLNGVVTNTGSAAWGWFEWGPTTNYGNVTPAVSLGSGNGATNFNTGLSNLAPRMIYHCRAVGSNSVGVYFGSNYTFVGPFVASSNAVTELDGLGSLVNVFDAAPAGSVIAIVVPGTIPAAPGINKNITLAGLGADMLTVNGGLSISSGVTAKVSDLSIVGGDPGIQNSGVLSLSDCSIRQGQRGIHNLGGTLALTQCSIVDNEGTGDGTGILNESGSVTMTNCTVSNNRGDSSPPAPAGVAIYSYGGGTVTMVSCTISGNQGKGGFGEPSALYGDYTLLNTLVADTSAWSPFPYPVPDISGSVISLGRNFVGWMSTNVFAASMTNGVNGDQVSYSDPPLNARLRPLGNYGGRVQTVALYPDSPVINAGDDALLNPPYNLSSDQRGAPRKVGSQVDIGAFEYLPGDINNDAALNQIDVDDALGGLLFVLTNYPGGVIGQSQLNLMLSNYWPHSPWLYLTNVAGLGGTNVSFALTNNTVGAFSVEFSTNLNDWQFLGPATPRYEFTDTNAPAAPQRAYRLRWP